MIDTCFFHVGGWGSVVAALGRLCEAWGGGLGKEVAWTFKRFALSDAETTGGLS